MPYAREVSERYGLPNYSCKVKSPAYDQDVKYANKSSGNGKDYEFVGDIYTSKFVNDITLDNHQVLTKSKQDEDINYYYGYNRTSSDEHLYHYDGQNTVTTLLDSQNKLIENYTYNDYGHRDLDYQAYISHNEFGNNGDALTSGGLQYLRARYYDTNTETFIQQDSYRGNVSDPITQNRYAYGYNNPNKYADPTGRWGWAKNLWNRAKSASKKVVNTVKKVVHRTVSTAKRVVHETVSNVKKVISTASKWVSNTVKSASSWVSNTVSSTKKWVSNTAKSVSSSAKRVYTTVKEKVVETIGYVNELGQKVYQTAEEIKVEIEKAVKSNKIKQEHIKKQL